MKSIITYLLKKTGIYQSIWNEFCDKYPVRISAETPELKKFMEENNKAFMDMMVYGFGCVQHIDARSINKDLKDVVRH